MVALGKRLWVEGVGTAWLVFVGCGSIVLKAGAVQQVGGVLEVSLAFGLAFATATTRSAASPARISIPRSLSASRSRSVFRSGICCPTSPRKFSAR